MGIPLVLDELMLLVELYQMKIHPGWNHFHSFGNRKWLPKSHVGEGLPQIQYPQECKPPANNLHYLISCCQILKLARMLQIVLPGTAFIIDHHIKNFIGYRIASTKTHTTLKTIIFHALAKEKKKCRRNSNPFRWTVFTSNKIFTGIIFDWRTTSKVCISFEVKICTILGTANCSKKCLMKMFSCKIILIVHGKEYGV